MPHCRKWGTGVTDSKLRFDVNAKRWEYSIVPEDKWTTVVPANELLSLAYGGPSALVGFVFDADPASPDFDSSLRVIQEYFSSEIADRVRKLPTSDLEIAIAAPGSLAPAIDGSENIMRPAHRLNSAVNDVVIIDDAASGVVTVSMTVPWWARFARPWVTVRRRGKRDILLAGPLTVRGRTAKAALRYGMPYSGPTLTADIVKGPRRRFKPLLLAALVAALFVAGISLKETSRNSTSGNTALVDGMQLPENGQLASNKPAGWDPQANEFQFGQVKLAEGTTCLGFEDEFTVIGESFGPVGAPAYLYLAVWDQFDQNIPKEKLVPVATRIISPTEISARVPSADVFETPPMAGGSVLVVLVSDPNAPLIFANSAVDWCQS